ncbi:MAG: hypothetical protein L3J41_16805 [Melioribacteraceae bacterium]|nr:hypothetical protein [Melioribacteraceae bacterium]
MNKKILHITFSMTLLFGIILNASLISKDMNAEYYEVVFNANQLSSEVYIYRIIVGEFTASKKMSLVK